MKLHDLAPPKGCDHGQAPGGPRHGGQGSQDGRPWDQGSEGPEHHARRLRGWPASPDAAHPEAEGVQEPVPGRVHPGQPGRARGLGADEVDVESWSRAAWFARRPWSRCWARVR